MMVEDIVAELSVPTSALLITLRKFMLIIKGTIDMRTHTNDATCINTYQSSRSEFYH